MLSQRDNGLNICGTRLWKLLARLLGMLKDSTQLHPLRWFFVQEVELVSRGYRM
jgi:hypothetical protein